MMAAIVYLIIGAFALYVLLPFFDKNLRNRRLDFVSPEQEELTFRKDEIVANMSDLEYDFQMKKITEPDYLQLKEKMTQDYINIKKKLDQLSRPPGKNHAGGVEQRQRETQRVGP